MLRVIGGDAGGRGNQRVFGVATLFRPLDARFEFADAGQILIQFVPVAPAQALLHRLRVLKNKIKDGPFLLPAAAQIIRAFAVRTGAEEPLKNLARIRLGRHRRGGRTPGEIVLIGAGIAGIARAGITAGVAGQFQRGKRRQMSHLAGDGLINRNSSTDVRGTFFHPHAGQKSAVGAGVIAAAVRPRRGVQMIQSADHLHQLVVGRERLQRAA